MRRIKYKDSTRMFTIEEGGKTKTYKGIEILTYTLDIKSREVMEILEDAQIVLPWHRYKNDLCHDIKDAFYFLINDIEGELKKVGYDITLDMRKEVEDTFSIEWLIDEFSNRDSWDDAFIGWCMLHDSIVDVYSRNQEW